MGIENAVKVSTVGVRGYSYKAGWASYAGVPVSLGAGPSSYGADSSLVPGIEEYAVAVVVEYAGGEGPGYYPSNPGGVGLDAS